MEFPRKTCKDCIKVDVKSFGLLQGDNWSRKIKGTTGWLGSPEKWPLKLCVCVKNWENARCRSWCSDDNVSFKYHLYIINWCLHKSIDADMFAAAEYLHTVYQCRMQRTRSCLFTCSIIEAIGAYSSHLQVILSSYGGGGDDDDN